LRVWRFLGIFFILGILLPIAPQIQLTGDYFPTRTTQVTGLLPSPLEQEFSLKTKAFGLIEKAQFDDDGGRAEGVALANGLTFVANYDQGLEIINSTDPSNPVKLSSKRTQGNALDVYVKGNFAYVSQGSSGVAIIDIQDPQNPRTIFNLDPGGMVREVDMYSNLLYIITDFNGFFLYDVSNPYDPKSISSWTDGMLHRGISVLKKHICLSTWGLGLKILDLTFPEKPDLIGVWNDSINYARGVYATTINEQKFAFLASSTKGVQIINITMPQAPVLVATIFNGWGEMLDITVKDGIAYCANADFGLLLANVSDPSNPVILDSYDTNGKTRDVAVENGLTVIAERYQGIKYFDTTNPADIHFLWQFFDHGQASNLILDGTTLYVADSRGGLEIFDVSELAFPKKIGFFREEGVYVQNFILKDDLAIVTAFDNGLYFINISDKTHPTKIASYNSGLFLRTVAEKGDLLFIAGLNNTIEVLNISNLSAISKVSDYLFPVTYPDIYSLTVLGSTLLVGSSYESLTLLNISDITHITQIDFLDFDNPVFSIKIVENYIFAAAGNAGLQIVNNSNNNLQVIGSQETSGYALDVALNDSLAFIADRTGGITVIDISNLSHLQNIGGNTAHNCYSIVLGKQTVFSGAWTEGLIIYSFDSDGDSISDEDESLYGTNPYDPDTDGDQMPDNFEINYHLNPLNATDAFEDPDEDGLTNVEEYAQEFFYGEPTDPFNPDTDGDFMPDGYEVANNLNPLLANGDADTDLDHLTNLEEYLIGTNPRKKDTDGDGAEDGLEVAFHTDPLNPKDYPAKRQLIRVLLALGLTLLLAITAIIFVIKYFRNRVQRNIEREEKVLEAEEEILLF